MSSLNLLLLGSVHGERVEKGSRDSDGRSDDGSSGHRCLECNNRCNNNYNTLDSVSNRMGNGVDLMKMKKFIF